MEIKTITKKLYNVFWVCQLVLALCLVSGCSNAEKAEKKKNQTEAAEKMAFAFMKEGRPSRAIQELIRAEKIDPESHQVKYSLGLAYWSRKEVGLAEVKFKEALILMPDFAAASNSLGALYLSQKRYQDAIEPLKKAATNMLYSTPEMAKNNLGWAYFKLGRIEEAEVQLQDAIDFAPNFQTPHRNLGILKQDQEQYPEAMVHLTRALELFPDDPQSTLSMGICQFKTGDREGAKKSFQRAWELNPGGDLGKSARTYLELMQ